MNIEYNIIEVASTYSIQEFISLPVRLYRNKKNWIRPLDSDIEKVFDPKQNKMFTHGECIRWILQDQNKNTIGRVAAFIDEKTKNITEQATGGLGFFECIDNKEAAFTLFDLCKNWLKDRKIEAMDGPINFGERHQWWGLHVEGDHKPVYCMPYHFKYYQEFFESYGFQIYFKQYTYRTKFALESLSEIIKWKANRLLNNEDYEVIHLNKKNASKLVNDFVHIYNEAWVKEIPGIDGISKHQAEDLFTDLKPIMHEKLIWFAYYKNEPIGFFIMIPDLNELLQHLNGKINLYGKLRFLYYKHLQKNKNALGLIFGVIPEFQKRGIEAAMIYEFSRSGFDANFPFLNLELNWIGDFNPRMSHLMEHIGGEIYKTHYTYRFLFDATKEFKRSEIIK
jgi:GNAT superfamily N-acetyltransferase